MTHARLRIGLIAGEASGDILGADLIRAVRARNPDVIFEGVGGPRMLAEGFDSLFPMERLSVMGLVEPLKRLPELLRIRASLRRHFLETGPALVLGIDSPDFNLGLELAMRRRGMTTAHYVSPSVWAWRRGRIRKIARAVDHMLCLFPFEEAFYRDHGVPVTFVGHPLADEIPLEDPTAEARRGLGLSDAQQVVALLPGSRGSEVKWLAPPFFETAQWLHRQKPALRFIVPAANAERARQLQELRRDRLPAEFPLTLVDGQSHSVMGAADAVLMASGTTTLEAMLLKKPMVVAYRMGTLSHAILSRMVKAPHIALPNLLAGREMVPERVQEDVRPGVLGPLLLERLENPALRESLKGEFDRLHRELARGAGARAAETLLQLIKEKGRA